MGAHSLFIVAPIEEEMGKAETPLSPGLALERYNVNSRLACKVDCVQELPLLHCNNV